MQINHFLGFNRTPFSVFLVPPLHLLRQEISSPSCGSKPSAPLQIGSRSVLVASGVVACQRESHGQGRVEADGASALDDVGHGWRTWEGKAARWDLAGRSKWARGGGNGRRVWGLCIYYVNLASGPTKKSTRFLDAKPSQDVRTRSPWWTWLFLSYQ